MTLTPADLQALGITLPPTQHELPYDDGEPMATERHKVQMELLIDGITGWLAEREDGYASGNMFVYYSLAQVKSQDFKGPDFFAVLGVPKGERLSWVCWEEGKTPDVVIELLSPSTATYDKTQKRQIYQNQLHVPEYFWFDPFNPEDWAGFRLQGSIYEPITLTAPGLISSVLQLSLVRWQGVYKGIEATWLRWANLEGTVLPTAAEAALQQAERERQRAEQAHQRAEQEHQRAEQERQRAEQERQRADKLADRLRALGLDPNEI